MKKAILFIATILFINITFAQDYSIEEIEVIQNLFGAEKKAIFEENIDLTGVDANAFWTIYQKYEAERKKIGKEKLTLLNQYTSKNSTATDAMADKMLKRAIQIRSGEDKLIISYTNRIKKATNTSVAVQFYQIEHYINDAIRYSILHNIEFIQDKK